MIPAFNDDGYLPAGVHRATLDEVAARFGQQSEWRRVRAQSLGWLVDLARRAGALRLIVNGSFTTDRPEPNDVDCVLLMGPEFPRGAQAEEQLQEGLPFIELKIVEAEEFAFLVDDFFATDRRDVVKGMIEVVL
ncbi:MAG TPA: hypothetical protein VMS17_21465 [Gemmataceae bacterium]|nr:hypothetical protein [Gemmataceae bacterium]